MCLPSFLPYAKEEKNNSLKTDACSDIHAKLFLQIGDLTTWSEKFKICFMSHMGLQRKFPMILQPRGGGKILPFFFAKASDIGPRRRKRKPNKKLPGADLAI